MADPMRVCGRQCGGACPAVAMLSPLSRGPCAGPCMGDRQALDARPMQGIAGVVPDGGIRARPVVMYHAGPCQTPRP